MRKLIRWIFGFNKEIKILNDNIIYIEKLKDIVINKLKQDLKDIIEVEEKKEVKIIYETSELKSKIIKVSITSTNEEYNSKKDEILKGLFENLSIELLPYIFYETLENDISTKNNSIQLTILTNKE